MIVAVIRLKLMKIYGVLLLVWSILVLLLSFMAGLLGYRGIETVAAVFVLTAISLCPAIISYTNCGLNGEDQSVSARHRIMQQHFRYWKTSQHIFVAVVLVVWILSAAIPNFFVDPFLFFVAAVGLLASGWSLFAYPLARTLFSSETREETDA